MAESLRSRTISARVASLGALQDKKGLNADEERCTQNTQMVQCGLQAVDHAFYLQARLAKIEQQAELQAGCLEIIGALHPVHVVFDRLQCGLGQVAVARARST